MSTALAPEFTPQLGMRVSPALVAFAEVLVLPALELDALIAGAADDNPALELAEPPAPDRTATTDPGALAVAEPSFADRVLAEARLALAHGDVPIAEYLLGNLDAHGFADMTEVEVASRLRVPVARVDRVLAILREAGPPALGARDLRASLLLQLDRIEREQGRDLRLARAVVGAHLPALARGAYAEIAAATGAHRADVARVRDLLRTELQAYPVGGESPSPRPPALLSDLSIGADLTVAIREPVSVRLSPLATHDAALRRDVDRARALLTRLDERRATLHRVATAAAEHQADFVRHGPPCSRPLTRGALACELGLHESTVSRAVAGKHVQLPDGRMVAFGAFFGSGLAARDALARMIAAETRPLSDGELADALARHGFQLARRTVAKYRDGLGILPHALR